MDLEAQFAEFLKGKFFWEPTAHPDDYENKEAMSIRKAQKKFSAGAEHIIPGRIRPAEFIETIKPMTLVLPSERKVVRPILDAISAAYNVSIDDLLGRSTSYKFVKAKRHLCWAMFRYLPNMNFTMAGKLLDKNHTTVMHGKNIFQKNMDHVKILEVDAIVGYK